MPGPATELLRRSPRARQWRLGTVALFLILFVSRLPPFFYTLYEQPDGESVRAFEEAASIASGRVTVPGDPARAHLASYIAAIPMFVFRKMAWPVGCSPDLFERHVLNHPLAFRRALGGGAAVCWLVLSLQVYLLVQAKSATRAALFALSLMIVSPLALALAGQGSVSLFSALLIFGALRWMSRLYERGFLRDYVYAGALSGIATGFAYHNSILLVVCLYAHISGERPVDTAIEAVSEQARGLACLGSFTLMAFLCNPQLWRPVARAVLVDPFITLGCVLNHMWPGYIFLNNDLGAQAGLVFAGSGTTAFLYGLMSVLGWAATIFALLLSGKSLVKPDQRELRPMAFFLFLSLACRLSSGLPPSGSIIVYAPVLSCLATLNVLGVVLRRAFRWEKYILFMLACLLSLETLSFFTEIPWRRGRLNTVELCMDYIDRRGIDCRRVYQIGCRLPGAAGDGRFPGVVTRYPEMTRIFAAWTRRQPDDMVKLAANRFDFALVSRPFVKAYTKRAPSGRGFDLAARLRALEAEAVFSPRPDTTIVGPELVLYRIDPR